jgi:hypothetical protein
MENFHTLARENLHEIRKCDFGWGQSVMISQRETMMPSTWLLICAKCQILVWQGGQGK